MMELTNYLADRQYQFELLLEIFSDIRDLQGVEQNPEWHGEGDVFVHTQMVCRELCRLPEWQTLLQREKTILYMAGLFHDIGKKICTKLEDQVMISPNHAVRGAKIFRELYYIKYAKEVHLPFDMREEIVSLIRYHGLPLLFMEKIPIEKFLIKAREEISFRLLYLLAKADLLGRECRDKQSKMAVIEYFKEYSKEIGCYENQVEFPDCYSRIQYFKRENGWYGDKIYDDTRFTVYVMSGLPLSGKDTYLQEYLCEIPVISLDQIRAELKISPKDGSGQVVSLARNRAKQYLRQSISFVWNATNIVVDTRKKVCEMCEAYGARVQLLYLEVPYQELLYRNKIRERMVPETVLRHMIRKLDVPKPTEVYEVRYLVSSKKD